MSYSIELDTRGRYSPSRHVRRTDGYRYVSASVRTALRTVTVICRLPDGMVFVKGAAVHSSRRAAIQVRTHRADGGRGHASYQVGHHQKLSRTPMDRLVCAPVASYSAFAYDDIVQFSDTHTREEI